MVGWIEATAIVMAEQLGGTKDYWLHYLAAQEDRRARSA